VTWFGDAVTVPLPGGLTTTVSVNVQVLIGLALLRGSGVPAMKSAELLSVSMHPRNFRSAAVVLVGDSAGLYSEQSAEP
jgi:hypothetical protein